MCSFRSTLVISATTLTMGFVGLDFFKDYTRYEFLVKGNVCIAFDHKDQTLKVVNEQGCISIPLTRSPEELIRDRTEAEITSRIRAELAAARRKTKTTKKKARRPAKAVPEDESEEEESEEASAEENEDASEEEEAEETENASAEEAEDEEESEEEPEAASTSASAEPGAAAA